MTAPKEVFRREYYESGQLKSEAKVIDDKENGIYREYHKNGQLKTSVNYVNGKANGIHYEYYENGQLKFETNYINGKENGSHDEYYENGKLKFEANFINGKENGNHDEYYENGELKFETNFKYGKKDGSYDEYYENGRLKTSANYVNGKKDGIYREYYENGELKFETNFINNELVSTRLKKEEKIKHEYGKYSYFSIIPEVERRELKLPFNKTNKDVIYIYEYHPIDDLPNDILRDALLNYKSYIGKSDDSAKIEIYSNFTHDIYYLIEKIIKEYKLTNDIYLVSIPCHLINKISPINYSIKTIINWTKSGHKLRCNLVDYSDLLIRSIDIEEEKKGPRNIETQLNSIDITKPLNPKNTYILLDDITTSGTIMDACVKKMVENGANERNIIRIAIAFTKRRAVVSDEIPF